MATRNDSDIINLLRQDPEKGFCLLMARYKEPIYWHIRRLVVSHHDAQDASQETFLRVFRSLNSFKGRSTFAVWLYRIATNEALRTIERKRGDRLSLDNPATNTADMAAEDYIDYNDLEAVRLQKVIQALPCKQRIAFNLHYYDDLEYEEIAQITDSTAASVKANYHIAKEKIIRFMNQF